MNTTACADDSGPCAHADDDADGIGNACDTCLHVANPEQLVEGSDDDADDDFVGNACEPDEGCRDRANPRAIGFFDVSADGYCCVRTYPGDGVWQTPEGLPIRLTVRTGSLPARLWHLGWNPRRESSISRLPATLPSSLHARKKRPWSPWTTWMETSTNFGRSPAGCRSTTWTSTASGTTAIGACSPTTPPTPFTRASRAGTSRAVGACGHPVVPNRAGTHAGTVSATAQGAHPR